jgi:hypothetical protein
VSRRGLRTFLFQAVHTIQRCDLVTLDQCRVVKNVTNEIAHGAIKAHHQLPDVDELAGLLTDDLHAQQFFVARIHSQLAGHAKHDELVWMCGRMISREYSAGPARGKECDMCLSCHASLAQYSLVVLR